MKLGIMQPYFVPYIGYWQLMNAVDQYVVYDDVNYINRGWINRNRILVNGKVSYFNVPMLGASQNKLINEIGVNPDKKLRKKNLATLTQAYHKAPYFDAVMDLMEQIINCNEENLAKYLFNSFHIICDYLGIGTKLLLSSELPKDCSLKGQDKILSICQLLGATEYYNAIGGQELYNFGDFRNLGMELKFLQPQPVVYQQFQNDFESSLSIVDVMMFNSVEQIQEMLRSYTLIDESSAPQDKNL